MGLENVACWLQPINSDQLGVADHFLDLDLFGLDSFGQKKLLQINSLPEREVSRPTDRHDIQ